MTFRKARPAIKVTLSRERATRVVSASEAGYISAMRNQVKAIHQNLEDAIRQITDATPEAIVFGLEPIMQESQRLVPVDTGDLKRSGFLTIDRTTTGPRVSIGYGRYGRPHYAAMVHERLDFRHAPPTQAKFLEQPIHDRIDDFRRRVELYMRRLTEGS